MAHKQYEWVVSRKRLAQWRAARLLTGSGMWMPLVGSFLVTGIIQISIGVGVGISAAIWLSAESFTAGLLLMYTFAYTYYPWLTPPAKRTALSGQPVNLLASASLEVLAICNQALQLEASAGWVVLINRVCRTTSSKVILSRLQLDPAEVIQKLQQVIAPTMTWAELGDQLVILTQSLEAEYIETEHLLGALLTYVPVQTYLREHDLQASDIIQVVWWYQMARAARQKWQRWWDPAHVLAFRGIGLSWVSGYTPLVDRFSRFPIGNLWDQILIGREGQIQEVISVLAKQSDANVLLVGAPGVGRLGVVKEVAHRVAIGQAHPALRGQRVVYLHIGEIIAQARSGAEQLAIIAAVLHEMEQAGNIIAVIDGLGSVLAVAGEERLNLTDVLQPLFSSRTVRVVVITSAEEYYGRLKTNEELLHYFEVIQINSISTETTLKIVLLAASILERQSKILLPYKTLRTAVSETESILPYTPFPERAFDILEEAIVVAQAQKKKVLLAEHIEELISRKTGIPVGHLKAEEGNRLLTLEETMHQRLVNQNRAVAAIARAMIRARAGVRTLERPIGTFLFLGPTGVGKTETAKTLAAVYFGSEAALIRFDMSEYQTEDTAQQLMGSPEYPVGRLVAAMNEHPFAVVLLDEFEKAHSSVQQLFLPILDEGQLMDAQGQVISFKHTIIIATSNAGSEFIRTHIKEGIAPANFDRQLREYILHQNIFHPELLNRFDEVVTFTPLTPEHVREVATRMLKQLNHRLDAMHGLTVAITPELLNFLQQVGYDPEFGARPLRRAIQDTVEYAAAQYIVRELAKPGDVVTLDPAQLLREWNR